MKNIRNKLFRYLEKPKNRFVFMFPSVLIWTVTLVNIWLHATMGVDLFPHIATIHIMSAIGIVLCAFIILFSDTVLNKQPRSNNPLK